jgi:hypothetical protein
VVVGVAPTELQQPRLRGMRNRLWDRYARWISGTRAEGTRVARHPTTPPRSGSAGPAPPPAALPRPT